MQPLKFQEPIDYNEFAPDNPSPKPRYNLPQGIQFCTHCTLSNQRPNSVNEFKNNEQAKKISTAISDDGLCDACRYMLIKNAIDWDEREKQLIELCSQYRRTDGSYDCLVPGSGGKDSIFVSHILKNKYGMNPLTMTYAPNMYTSWGWKNMQRWIGSGSDNYLFSPNSRVHRLLTRLALEVLFHPFQPFMIGQKSFAPKLAAKLDIPLIFYGENPAEYGNPLEENLEPLAPVERYSSADTNQLFLGGVSVPELISEFGLTKQDLNSYLPAHPDELSEKNIHFTYLGYYLKWHVQDHFYYAVEHAGFEPSPERTIGSYTKSVGIDDKLDDFNFYTSFIKFGIGRATYESCQDIRCDDLNRAEAVEMIKRYDGEFPERFSNEVFEYLSVLEDEMPIAAGMFEEPIMTRDYFLHLCDRFRSPHIWQRVNQEWQLRKAVWM